MDLTYKLLLIPLDGLLLVLLVLPHIPTFVTSPTLSGKTPDFRLEAIGASNIVSYSSAMGVSRAAL